MKLFQFYLCKFLVATPVPLACNTGALCRLCWRQELWTRSKQAHCNCILTWTRYKNQTRFWGTHFDKDKFFANSKGKGILKFQGFSRRLGFFIKSDLYLIMWLQYFLKAYRKVTTSFFSTCTYESNI